jgi:hypothetical protein
MIITVLPLIVCVSLSPSFLIIAPPPDFACDRHPPVRPRAVFPVVADDRTAAALAKTQRPRDMYVPIDVRLQERQEASEARMAEIRRRKRDEAKVTNARPFREMRVGVGNVHTNSA